LLQPNGQLCFLIPRSYASGSYFTRFRRRLHHFMQLRHVHVFESRSAAFKSDKVLQENIVVLYSKGSAAPTERLTLSVSEGVHDLPRRRSFKCASSELISTDDGAVVALPTTPDQSYPFGQPSFSRMQNVLNQPHPSCGYNTFAVET
jgi:adenine-specific DNA-methyltransferase